MTPSAGLLIDGRYRLLHRLGAGGMGEVWAAHQASLDRQVAVKLLKPPVDDELVVRFQREARAVSRIHHENVVVVHDTGTCKQSGLHFIAMELLEGESLRASIVPGGLPEAELVALARQILAGLAAAHAKGIIHRDIKPQNIVVANGRVKLVDFGIARRVERGETLTVTGAFLGTPGYVAPEVAMGTQAPDPKCDIYAAGVVLFQLLTGSAPFEATSPLAVTMKHVSEPAPRASSRVPVSALAPLQRLESYDRAAILVKSMTGTLQVSRNARKAGSERVRVFQSEEDALAYLLHLPPIDVTAPMTTKRGPAS